MTLTPREWIASWCGSLDSVIEDVGQLSPHLQRIVEPQIRTIREARHGLYQTSEVLASNPDADVLAEAEQHRADAESAVVCMTFRLLVRGRV